MYDMLATAELTVLQQLLFDGTEAAFSAASEKGLEPDSARSRRTMHTELAHLFIEAGEGLSRRLEPAAAGA